MSPAKRRSVGIVLMAAATFAAADWALVRPRPHGHIHIVAEKSPAPDEDGLVLDVSLPSVDDQARLAYRVDSRTITRVLPRRVFTNPLLGDGLSIALRNTSGADVELANGGSLCVTVDLRDARGQQPKFRFGRPSGLKWLGMRLPGGKTFTLAAGERIERRSEVWGGLDPHAPPGPGTYTARIACRYIRESDGAERVVTSAPIDVEVTEEDVADYRVLATAIEGNWPAPRDAVGLILDAVHLPRW